MELVICPVCHEESMDIDGACVRAKCPSTTFGQLLAGQAVMVRNSPELALVPSLRADMDALQTATREAAESAASGSAVALRRQESSPAVALSEQLPASVRSGEGSRPSARRAQAGQAIGALSARTSPVRAGGTAATRRTFFRARSRAPSGAAAATAAVGAPRRLREAAAAAKAATPATPRERRRSPARTPSPGGRQAQQRRRRR